MQHIQKTCKFFVSVLHCISIQHSSSFCNDLFAFCVVSEIHEPKNMRAAPLRKSFPADRSVSLSRRIRSSTAREAATHAAAASNQKRTVTTRPAVLLPDRFALPDVFRASESPSCGCTRRSGISGSRSAASVSDACSRSRSADSLVTLKADSRSLPHRRQLVQRSRFIRPHTQRHVIAVFSG